MTFTSIARTFKDRALKLQVAAAIAAPGVAHAGFGTKALDVINQGSTLALAVGGGIFTICAAAAGYQMAANKGTRLSDVAHLIWGGALAGSAAALGAYFMG